MKVDGGDVNFDELARCTEDFNGAQMKAVAVEAGKLCFVCLHPSIHIVLLRLIMFPCIISHEQLSEHQFLYPYCVI